MTNKNVVCFELHVHGKVTTLSEIKKQPRMGMATYLAPR
jgi:hypothetical protein